MSASIYQPWVHRIAVLTAVLALAPITMGALVTTLDAGMAFPDWPTSDGAGMLTYPWLRSVGDKFLEHGHRLAGIAIGCCSVVLAVVMGIAERRFWARWLGLAVLLAVVAQGLLGGQRVLSNSREFALIHGVFGAWVFAGVGCVALITSRGWNHLERIRPTEWSRSQLVAAVSVVLLIQMQYLLGGMLRHQGRMVYEHIGGACVVLPAILWLWYSAMCSGSAWLKRSVWWLSGAVIAQILLGLLTYVARFGFGGNDVAVPGAPFAVWTRTGHTLLGMTVWMLTVQHLLRVCRVHWLYRTENRGNSAINLNATTAWGGAA